MAEEQSKIPTERAKTSLAADLVDTIKEPALDAFVEGTELLLDMFMDEGVLRDIPIVGPVVGLGKSLLSVPDRLFFRKLGRFLKELDQVSEKERIAFAEKIEREGAAQKVGEKVLMIVDQLDGAEKASLAGQVFKAYVNGVIYRNQFDILCSCITLTRIADLNSFIVNHDHFDRLDPSVARALCLTGLADWDINIGQTALDSDTVESSMFYKITPYGKLLAQILNE